MLHGNELPLRHLLQNIDGTTSGPRAFSGPIGKSLVTCEQLPVVNYSKIQSSDLPIIDFKNLSTDQKYLWRITKAVSDGHCPEDLAKQEPGTLNHSRWITTANRILRLYIAKAEPSNSLQILATNIVKVYAPMWFNIKTNSLCTNGAKHVLSSIKLSRYLSNELKSVVHPVIQRNAYFAHPENLLLSLITDERQHIRELGIRRILKTRSIMPTFNTKSEWRVIV